jgi:hypothetical protein
MIWRLRCGRYHSTMKLPVSLGAFAFLGEALVARGGGFSVSFVMLSASSQIAVREGKSWLAVPLPF